MRILVPFSRPHLIPTLVGIWGKAPDGVHFHPIISDPTCVFESTDWIHPFYCGEVPAGWNQMYWKLNYYLDQMPIHENEMYGFLCDDDAFEPEFYEKVFQYPDDAIIVSMKRGKHDPGTGNGHPPTALIACKENMKQGKVGMEQLFIRGSHLKNLRFENFSEADGKFIVNIVNNLPVKYLPRAFIWFNYLEPGRWT